MNDLSAKVFRTYNASITLQDQLQQPQKGTKVQKDTAVDVKVKFYNDCNREVAKLCNHKKAEAKNLKEQLDRMEGLIKDKQKEAKDLEAWKKSLKSKKTSENPKNFPKTMDACDIKIKKLRE
mmetsp:Transcript_29798/g.45439  ORF Transcript_29798/g.45439 Transcript_29798/m.45439 type:complete len:122 (+) Transcript_29798:1318-1683(+)